MVFKPSIGSVIDAEEEDVYLRKCNIRKSRRQNEKSRRISQQANEHQSLDRTPSPVPPPSIKTSGSTTKGKFRSTFVPPDVETSSVHSTDDVYPAPSPPPRSPSFGSPVALTRTLALSLSLFTPGGHTISTAKKSATRRSPETSGLCYSNVIGRSRSDSNGSWGEFAITSPQKSPNTDFHKSYDSAEKSPRTTTASPIDVDAYKESPPDGENTSYSKDSSRVKQFLFHRDRDRARKAQLAYPFMGGNTADITHYQDWDDYEYGGADHKTPGKRGSPTPEGSNRRTIGSRRGSGGSGNKQQSRSASKSSADSYITVDLETDIRASTNGAVFTAQSSERKVLKFHRSPPLTPYVVIPTPPKDTNNNASGTEDPFGHNSPYYRALTLGFSSPAVEKNAVLEKNGYAASAGAGAGATSKADGQAAVSSDSEHSVCTAEPLSPRVGVQGTSATKLPPQKRKDSTSSERSHRSDSDHSVDPSGEAYNTLFPALPVVKASSPQVSGLSALSLSLAKPVLAVELPTEAEDCQVCAVEEVEGGATTATTTTDESSLSFTPMSPEAPQKVIIAPLPLYTAAEVGSMLHQALLRASSLLNYPNGPPVSAITPSKSASRAMRAWDDADSSDSEDDCSHSDASSRDNDSVTSSISSVLQEQVQKLSEIDATCGSLMQKCDYIYDILKCRFAQRFDVDFVRNVCASHVRDSTVVKSQEHPPVQEVMLHYVRPHLVYSLVQSLQYEDTRFESPRLPILYVLYKSSGGTADTTSTCSMRTKVAHAIESATQERYDRCVRLLTTASAHEMDINYISKEGYADLVGAPHLSAVDTIAASCDQNARYESENERANYKTKDSEITIIELVKFIIAHEINESLLSLQEQEVDTLWSPSKTPPSKSTATSAAAQHRYAQSSTVLGAVTRAYCSLFRCYTHKLGAHYAGSSESVEQPVLLEHLMQVLDGLLAWSKILTNLCHPGGINNYYNSSCSHSNQCGSPDDAKRSVSAQDTPLDRVCSAILSSTYKYWVTGLNYAQDIAYLLQSEVVLAIYAPSSTSSNGNSSSASYVSYSSTFRAGDKILPPLLVRKDIVHNVLMKMLAKVTSQHTKVATQALQSIQNPVLMVRYFLPRITTAMVSYIFGTEVGRITFLSGAGWDNQHREDCLNALVDRLRECREIYQHYNQQLQVSSAQLLDTTLELLQVIEDAE